MSEFQSTSAHVGILFVCLGNICRSPLAEGVFRHLVREAGTEEEFRIDSAGTGAWHVGNPPDPRSREVARRNGIELVGVARQVRPDDFDTFDLIVAMDLANRRDLEELAGDRDGRADLALLRAFDPEAQEDAEVPDPYYGGPDGFDEVFRMIRRSCAALLEDLEARRAE